MELKGQHSKKMPKEKKTKAKQTLKRMEQTRVTDDQYLREVTKKKIEWAESEKAKGLNMIAQHERAIANLRQQIAKLDGAITALTEINTLPNKPKDEEKK